LPISFSFYFGLVLLFRGLVVLKPGEIILDFSPKWLANLKIIPRPCHAKDLSLPPVESLTNLIKHLAA
jgi:hypothetical protein